ncbi:hypothetical protein CCR94_00950 [Rhodoblastus sphagnicola]|uniref:Uncharacterized protein n=1 Tax=Rhodoblastus sphagnicola TaxID=333368 RepID=A0A2S6NG85_9HYPH|nr:hypothetical protein CCR94_00950 [Rhodoblastus sphagnicola]
MVLSCLSLEGVRLHPAIPSVTPKETGREAAQNPPSAHRGVSDFAARGIRPSGRRGKSLSAARLCGPTLAEDREIEAILSREEFARRAKGTIVASHG